ncbi:short-chain dehydrogenase/reductase-like protein SDR [Amniculicola lignicola CBS 123094]|uniref:Short-chain dehydrogenase/reductase-like protein SDR n=1 Tax=Amniculicola lignicola CBS 123094 TaxID=1392246 RepID=A0A6A5WGS6_9PLEO|nr:short-chain dehydrogenase/reductase-like protein SDR [Amniculicola lignicola CBS 123094]
MAPFNTILLLGATSGLGESAAKRLLGQGKKVIVTGRRQARLDALKAEGLETYAMDVSDIAAIPKHFDTLFSTYPDIDTVWINSGMATRYSVKDINSYTDADLALEVTTNLTAAAIIARHAIPRFLARGEGVESHFLITTSGLAYVPIPFFPVYNACKAGLHYFLVSLRQQLRDSPVSVIEIVPPYVATEYVVENKDEAPKNLQAMSLKDYEDEVFAQLDNIPAKQLKEVAAGPAVQRVKTWRDGLGAMIAKPFAD